jgi:glucose-6-phosphate-specific signal transduction histidine kinase
MKTANAYADRHAFKDEIERLREVVSRLERELARARRCIAAERYAREKRVAELKDEAKSSEYAISLLSGVLRRVTPQED